MRPIVRGAAAVLAVPALTLSALVATSAPAAAAVDPAPATAAAAWLAGQVPESGLFAGDFGADYGLSIDVALALDTVEDDSAVVSRIRDAVAAEVNSYIAYSYEDGGVTHTGQTGGATAKALVLDRSTGGTGADFGGVDLVERLESLVDENGRVISTFDGAPDASYDNTYIQTLAVAGLDGTGSDARGRALGYLLDQQCATGGYFRGDIPEAASDPCADEPDADATARAVLALQDESTADEASADAVEWLLAAQRKSGAFGGGVGTEAPNANSTGLAAAALVAAGEDAAAAKAAAWLRAHQATNVANCVYYDSADLGAVFYDDAARSSAQGGAMDAALTSQTVRATSQVITGLQAASAGPGQPNVLSAPDYVKAGGTTQVGVNDAAPGEALCAMLGEQSVLGWANPQGDAGLELRLPKKAGTSTVEVANAGGTLDTVEVTSLGAAKLPVSVKSKRIAVGQKQVVTVKDLAPGESVHVEIEWPSNRRGGSVAITAGQANRKGVFKVTAKVPNRPGTAQVSTQGQFKNRKGATSFTVIR
ncbi:hypothetical protein [Nocardioides sp. SR21]|uniref:hypothetical protein n=1 Tax=Nocardioides sp. SR21 TaxID=2919501 RepID=UPI001FAA6C2A|nr:hypothetical protein [Nocardioides sp. SR21]